MVEHSAYLLSGDDELSKKEKIESLKRKILDKGLGELNFEIVYGNDKNLKPSSFDEVLRYGPSEINSKRIILIKRIETLPASHREILIRYLKKPLPSVVVILDSAAMVKDSPFLRILSKLTKPLYISSTRQQNVFDLTRAIQQRNVTTALEILNHLLNNREKPLRILGGIYWYWEKIGDQISLEKFRKGLKVLLDTDLRIKTSAIKEDMALEMLVIRLSYLMR